MKEQLLFLKPYAARGYRNFCSVIMGYVFLGRMKNLENYVNWKLTDIDLLCSMKTIYRLLPYIISWTKTIQ